MAKAPKPDYTGLDEKGCDRISDQLRDWWQQMNNFENKEQSEREGLVDDMKSILPSMLSNVNEAIAAFENGRLDNLQNLELVMKHMHYLDLSFGRISWMSMSISNQQSELLKTVKDKLAAIKIEELQQRIANKTKELETPCIKDTTRGEVSMEDNQPKNINSRQAQVQRKDVMAIRVKVCTPDLRNEVVEGVCLDENEQIETEVYHIHPRQVSAVCYLPTQKAEESLEINQSFDEKEILVKCKEDKITFSVLLPMMKQYWKYNLRIKRNGTWGTTEGKQRNKYIDFEFELLTAVYVVVTSTTLAQSINLFPTETLDYTFAENDEIKLHCPKGAVKEQEQIDVWLTYVDKMAAESNKKRKCSATNIVGVSSIVHIKHERPFEKALSLTLPIEMLEEADLSTCDLVSFHCVNNIITIANEDEYQIDIKKGNTCTLRTKYFSGRTIAVMRRQTSAQAPVDEKELEMIHGLSDPCNILIFLARGLNDKEWMMMAEIVPESESDARIVDRKTKGKYVVPRDSKSGSVLIRRNEKITVNVIKRGAMEFGPEISKPPSITYIHNLKEHYALFPTVGKQGIHKSTRAIVEFSTGQGLFHTAYPCPDLLQK